MNASVTAKATVLRLLLVLVLASTSLLAASRPSVAEDDWRAGSWYGWIELHKVGEESGDGISAQGTDETVRVRVTADHAKVIAASGTSWNDTIDRCDFTSHTTLGPGSPIPFGDDFAVLGDPSTPANYTLSTFNMSLREQRTRTDCAPLEQIDESAATGFELGCGPFDWDTGQETPCLATDTGHLTGSVDYVDAVTYGSYRTTASWDLVQDPAQDPCLTLADRCLEEAVDKPVTVATSGTGGAMGAACGKATFRWRRVTLSGTSVYNGERVCVFLLGNQAAQKILSVAANQGVDIGSAFAGTVLRAGVITHTPDVAKWGAEQAAQHVILRRLGAAVEANSARFTPIVAIGAAVGLLAVPLAAGVIVDQIINKKACIQVITDIDTGALKVDWSMVYAQATDLNKTRAKVYRRVDRRYRPDTASPSYLQMTCSRYGTVKVYTNTSSAMSYKRTTILKPQ